MVHGCDDSRSASVDRFACAGVPGWAPWLTGIESHCSPMGRLSPGRAGAAGATPVWQPVSMGHQAWSLMQTLCPSMGRSPLEERIKATGGPQWAWVQAFKVSRERLKWPRPVISQAGGPWKGTSQNPHIIVFDVLGLRFENVAALECIMYLLIVF